MYIIHDSVYTAKESQIGEYHEPLSNITPNSAYDSSCWIRFLEALEPSASLLLEIHPALCADSFHPFPQVKGCRLPISRHLLAQPI